MAIRPWWLVIASRDFFASKAIDSTGSLASNTRLLASSTIAAFGSINTDSQELSCNTYINPRTTVNHHQTSTSPERDRLQIVIPPIAQPC